MSNKIIPGLDDKSELNSEMVNRKNNHHKKNFNDDIHFQRSSSFIFDNAKNVIDTMKTNTDDVNFIDKRNNEEHDQSKNWRNFRHIIKGFISFITLLKPLIILILLLHYKPKNYNLFFNILFNWYDEKNIQKEEKDPVYIEIQEKYIALKYDFYDIINSMMRKFSSKLINTKKVRSGNIREHILQEQTEDHNSAKEAIIKIMQPKNILESSKPRVRIGKGTLFGIVINGTDNKKLSELLYSARRINEEIQSFLSKDNKEKDLYYFDKDKEYQDYFKSNIDKRDFLKKASKHYVFETRNTIYGKMNKFITNWFIVAAYLQNKNNKIDTKFNINSDSSIKSEWIIAAKYCFLYSIDNDNDDDKDKNKKDEELKDRINNSSNNENENENEKYDRLMIDLSNTIKKEQENEDSFYIEEIKQFILTALTRKVSKANKSNSVMDKTLKKLLLSDSTDNILCSDLFEEFRIISNELDDSPWTKHSFFEKETMKDKWESTAKNLSLILKGEKGSSSPRVSDLLITQFTSKKLESKMDFNPDNYNDDDDEDIEWFFDLLEDSRKYHWEIGRDKHFSEFTIDKVLIRKRDAVGSNIIHVSYLYKKYASFGRWLVEQYPTIAVESYSDKVGYALRVSAVKENLYITSADMPYTGETILHMTVIARNLEETRWLLDFYRSHEHNTNDGLKKLLMAAATGSFFHNDGAFYAGAFPIHFSVCCNDTDMFDLIVTYASNIKNETKNTKSKSIKESNHKIGSNIIFIRDQYGNNCLHLAVHHKLQEMYLHVLNSAKAFLKRDIKTAYAKQLSDGEKSNKISENNFPTLHDTMKNFFFIQNARDGSDPFGYDRIEKSLKMPEDLSSSEAFEVWINKQVKEKLNERFLQALNNDFHTPLTLCAQCVKCEDDDDEIEQKEMLAFLLNSELRLKWSYGPLTCSAISLEGFDYRMTVKNKYKPLCKHEEYDKNNKPNKEYRKFINKLLHGRIMGVLDWICYRDRPFAAEIPIIETYINLKWERFANPIVNKSFYESFIIALAITLTCCFSNQSPSSDWKTPAELAVTVLYPIIGILYCRIFLIELSLLFSYGSDYFGLKGGIRSSALFDKIARFVAMVTFLTLCITKIISFRYKEANVYKWDDTNETWSSIDRPRENIPMALNAIFAWVYMYYFFMASDTYGSFVITISRIIGKDIPYFLSFYLIVVAAFSCALSTLTNSGDPEAIYGFRALIYCFWDLIQVTVGAGDYINPDLNCTDMENVPYDLQWLYSILITLFYMAVQIMMLNLLIGMIGNTYNEYTDSSKSLLLLEKYNVTCSMERYFDKKEINDERKKYAIELNEDDQKSDEPHNNWAFDHLYFDKEWKNNSKEEISGNDDDSIRYNSKEQLPEKIVLLIIMPQKDFHTGGSLAVPNANEDSERIAKLIEDENIIERIDEIYVALDSHYRTHIAHAICWKHVEYQCPFENKNEIIWKEKLEMKEEYSLKKYKWELYNIDESEDDNIYIMNYFHVQVEDNKLDKITFGDGFFKTEDEYTEHCNKPYENLPFKKLIKLDKKKLLKKKKDIKDLNDSEIKSCIVEEKGIEYWYHPKPFTVILNENLTSGLFEVIKNSNFDQNWAESYTKNLEKKKNYTLTIWPEHCIIGSSGHGVVEVLNNALQKWARRNQKSVQYIEKGQNCKTELYSILEAEVEDPEDPTTAFDADLFSQLKIADRILICGQASSHCVKFTVSDLKKHWPEDDLSKIMLLKNCCSPVISPFVDFPKQAEEFFEEMNKSGLTVINCEDVFAKIDEKEIKSSQQYIDEQQNLKIKAQEDRDKKQDEMLKEIKDLINTVKK